MSTGFVEQRNSSQAGSFGFTGPAAAGQHDSSGVCISCVIACVVDILYSRKQGFLLVQAALAIERKAKEEAHIAMAAAEEAAAQVKVGIQTFVWHQLPTIASVCNTADPVLTCLSSGRRH
jgi:hypothetical protein